MLRWLILCGAVCLQTASAAPISFAASGIFQDGSVLSGNVTIDTATGIVNAADLVVTGIPEHFTTITVQRVWPQGPSPAPFLSEVIFHSAASIGSNELVFLFPPLSLIGYSGGILCGASTTCSDEFGNHYFSNLNHFDSGNGTSTNFIELTSGELSSAPEPATFSLVIGALLFAGTAKLAKRS
jgi:hypothetical protein